MTNAPERIWIEDEFGDGDEDQWTYGTWDVRNYRGYVVEYVRADIVQNLTAERDRLRKALEACLATMEHADFEDGWCCCGDNMLHHQSPMDCGHTPVDMGEYHASLAIKKARAALKGESHE